ncbi:9826_t:CDS:2, partial [Funneliformis geosporum]
MLGEFGDFVRIKDSQIAVDQKLETIREHLKVPYKGVVRFGGKTTEQIAKERYDKVLEEVNFDYDKLHDWLYKEENKDKVEIVKLEGSDFQAATEAIFNKIKSKTGQIIYPSFHLDKEYNELRVANWKSIEENYVPMKGTFNNTDAILIDWAGEVGNTSKTGNNKYNSVVIFLHGTYGHRGIFKEMEPKLPHTKIIYPYSPTLQYDMWHGAAKAPGGQCQDYPQLRRATSYVNDIIEGEIANGISPEKIFVAGYSQGGLLTLAVALTSPHQLGGFISLCGLLPQRGYNVEFKTHPGLGHIWKNEDITEFLEKCFDQKAKKPPNKTSSEWNTAQKLIISGGVIGIV